MEAYWYFDFASPFAYLQLAKVQGGVRVLPFTAARAGARIADRQQRSRGETTVPEDSAGVSSAGAPRRSEFR
jgi:hypothetical protein